MNELGDKNGVIFQNQGTLPIAIYDEAQGLQMLQCAGLLTRAKM
jgi:hypothetical protein